MLGSLFKPAWQSKSIEKRLQFVSELSDTTQDNLNILKTLIQSDTELRVREAALTKISEPAIIFEIIKTHSDSQTRDKAITVFNLLTGPKSKLSEQEFKTLIQKHSETTLSITKSCPHANLRLELLNKLSLAEQVDLLSDIEYSDTRVHIAEKIESIELLEKARNNLKGKDKNAEKIVKTKLHDLHAAIKQEEENLEKAETLCDSMEYLAGQNSWRNEFKDRHIQCNRQWKDLNFTPNDYLLQRYEIANNKVSQILKEQEKLSLAIEQQSTTIEQLEQQSSVVSKLSLDELAIQFETLNNNLITSNSLWKSSLEVSKPEKTVWNRYEVLYRSLDSALNYSKAINTIRKEYLSLNQDSDIKEINESSKKANSLLANLEWSKDLPKLACKEQTVTDLSRLKDIASKLKSDTKEKLDNLHKRINRLQSSTKKGNLNQARRELAAVIKLGENYSGKEKSTLDERLEKATIAVDKMADWKDYATAPKFIELCEAMEALSPEALKKSNKSNMHADKLAAKITELQKNWKALGYSDSADAHWERFKTAADLAYAPCDEFFKKRHKLRQANLANREPLIKQTQDLVSQTNWQDNNDCKKALNTVRKIDTAWKKIKDVEPGPGTKQWKRLRKAKNAVYAKLDEVYASNLSLKKTLITTAEELVESELKNDSLKKLQSLQSQWKSIGITKRKDDQKAWNSFKKITDAIFEKIQNQRKAKRAQEDEQLKPYRDLVKAIRKLSNSAKNLAEADSNFEKYQKEHDALAPIPYGLPEKVIEGIKKDYLRACKDFDKTRERLLQNKKHQALDNLAAKAALCSEYEALANDASQVELDDLVSQMDALEITDNELKKRFKQRLELARESNRRDYTEARRLMCIDLEILLGKDSPEEDKALRMQIQLDRMQQGGFGQERLDTNALLKKMKLDWYCMPGAEPVKQKKLDQRFTTLLIK